jgi:hypothetical protein
MAALVFAYLVRFLAVALSTVESGLARLKPSYTDAARVLGRRPGQAVREVEVPLARGAAASKPARPGRAPTLASPGERARGGRGAGTGGARPAGAARGASAGRSTGGRKR